MLSKLELTRRVEYSCLFVNVLKMFLLKQGNSHIGDTRFEYVKYLRFMLKTFKKIYIWNNMGETSHILLYLIMIFFLYKILRQRSYLSWNHFSYLKQNLFNHHPCCQKTDCLYIFINNKPVYYLEQR